MPVHTATVADALVLVARARCASRSRAIRSPSTCAATGAGCIRGLGIWCADGEVARPVHPAHRGRHRRRGARAARAGRRLRASPSRSPTAPSSRCDSTAGAADACASRCPATRRSPSSSRSTARRCASAPAGTRAPRSTSPGSARATRCASTTPAAGSSSAPTAPTPAPTARRHARDRRHPAGRLRARAVAAVLARLRRARRRPRQRHALSTSAPTRTAVSARAAAGPAAAHDLHRPLARRAPAPLPARHAGCPPVLPEWGYGFWKSRDVYDAPERRRGRLPTAAGDTRIPLDALVLDSPWETQYNTWEPNPHQFPDFAGDGARAFAPTACARSCGSRRG